MKKVYLPFLFMISFVWFPAEAKTFEESCTAASGTITVLEERNGKKTNLCAISSFLACTEEQLLSGACLSSSLASYQKTLTNTSSSTCNIFAEFFWSPELGRCAQLPDFLNYIKEKDLKATSSATTSLSSLATSVLDKIFGKQPTHNLVTSSSSLPTKEVAQLSKPSLCSLPAVLLKRGSTGVVVQALQQHLKEKGFLDIPSPTTYFGPKTTQALISYQKSLGVVPSSGIFGDITRGVICK
jgi:hypothetical protein